MSVCRICIDEGAPEAPEVPYHPGCLERLFGAPRLPQLRFDRSAIPEKVERSVGKFSISGVQPKAQADLGDDGGALTLGLHGCRYLLKPEVATYPCLPANEHLTMVLAARCGIEVPPHGLVELSDGSLAYLVRRFDRPDADPSHKRTQEDFCSLSDKRSGDKYDGSTEQCFKLMRKYAADPEDAARRLFRQVCFSYWVGNGDLHLKNLSLLEREDGAYTLSPAYDLVSTWVYGDRELALPVCRKKQRVTRPNWIDLAERHASIPRAEAEGILDRMLAQAPLALATLARSAIADPALCEAYSTLVTDRTLAMRGPPNEER
jgi:serine/threonine-protein kinase HipA